MTTDLDAFDLNAYAEAHHLSVDTMKRRLLDLVKDGAIEIDADGTVVLGEMLGGGHVRLNLKAAA